MTPSGKPSASDIASWIAAVLGMIFVLHFRLLGALLAGLLICELVHALYPLLIRRLNSREAKGIALGLVLLAVLGTVSAAVIGVIAFMRSEGGSLPVLLAKMAEIVEQSRAQLPAWISQALPPNVEVLRDTLGNWLRSNASEFQRIGKETGHSLAHLLIGMIIGAIVSVREASLTEVRGPLARALGERCFRLAESFRRVVFAQVRISAINTFFTFCYLALVLPAFGISLPLVKTMIVVTFIAGLLPVIGNLISNTVIFVVSLAHSPLVAVTSLGYLIVIHKLEYFLNARIVGTQIRAKAWELLTAMLVMESAFGLAGLAAAPICYAWLKDELRQRRLV